MTPLGTPNTGYLLHFISILYTFLLCPQLAACKLNISDTLIQFLI